MKRVIKWSLILGAVCCLSGVGMMTAGVMMGGADYVTEYVRRFPDLDADWDEHLDFDRQHEQEHHDIDWEHSV